MTGTEGRRVTNVPLFLNGEGMRGGRVHPHIARYPFLGEARTASRYRFYVYEDRFPALWPVHDGGVSVPVELGVVELTDGHGGWRAYLKG